MKSLTEYVSEAQAGNEEAMVTLYRRFYPLILKESSRYGELDLDCLQELSVRFVILIQKIELNRV
ncbi:helix-turn-helix domain-containing protein [Enterococcus faecalis]|uniref:helix-turn-helix domain-containing protein n=1 Tax=Enterococcus faecalis TaxID=1351 RepID=UPI0012E20A0D|nr:helix-turn-helix domain-containing protein [Enterococcus faecalis]EGO5016487.1 helix-turn-helix domain-containing protein [Enterococcus faecalis]EGO6561358.1 helix-turn-helix domain-containing protein [Enterococcus faecalis]EGO7560959.1 helix-turn-helix domain-containing protein [Enterococcus faecalis]EGO7742731.1 helix-turn-helix domain-containing protein [Enterococcus faecalis]EGO8387416.1 helix-turn-helix domain-containing protein [Enterococcus faecalis]